MRHGSFLGVAVVVSSPFVLAVEIEGVQVASMDQPRVTVMVRRAPNEAPLAAKGDPGMAALLGMDPKEAQSASGFAAFLDTGASGISISSQTADGLGIRRMNVQGKNERIIFHDVGVGGLDQFHVGEALHYSVGSYQSLGLSADAGSFKPVGGAWSPQVGPLGGGGLLGMMIGGIDVLGMPAMVGKVVAIDARPVNTFSDTLRVQLYDPRTERPNLPQTHRHVQMTYGDFGPFTLVEPKGATKPVCAPNPFIGKAPVLADDPRMPKGITIRFGGKSATGAWLLDTGAAASMISTSQAEALGIRYKPGTEGTSAPVLEGVPVERQFSLAIGGMGGTKNAAGFYLDELRVPTFEGDDLIYRPAPVLVADITVEHPETGQKITLDGIFGMNFLVASARVTGGMVPELGEMAEGPYDWIVIDHTKGVLGVALRKELRDTNRARGR